VLVGEASVHGYAQDMRLRFGPVCTNIYFVYILNMTDVKISAVRLRIGIVDDDAEFNWIIVAT
jgi:hypothetical protein